MDNNHHLEEAAKATSIHAAFRQLRLASGLTLKQFKNALLPHLPAGVAPSEPAVLYWETEPGEKKSNLPSRKIFAGTDPITAYGGVFHDLGMGEWFDAHAEHFRQLLLEAMNSRPSMGTGHAQRWNSSDIQRDKPEWLR